MENAPKNSKKERIPIGEKLTLSFELSSPFSGDSTYGKGLDAVPVKFLVAEAAKRAFEQVNLALGENEEAAGIGGLDVYSAVAKVLEDHYPEYNKSRSDWLQ